MPRKKNNGTDRNHYCTTPVLLLLLYIVWGSNHSIFVRGSTTKTQSKSRYSRTCAIYHTAQQRGEKYSKRRGKKRPTAKKKEKK